MIGQLTAIPSRPLTRFIPFLSSLLQLDQSGQEYLGIAVSFNIFITIFYLLSPTFFLRGWFFIQPTVLGD